MILLFPFRSDLFFLILESVCGLSSISLLPFLSCQMAAGPDLTSRLLRITETVLQDFFHHSHTHFHPRLEFYFNKTTSKHFTDPQVACLSPTLGLSYASISPMPLPWARVEWIRIYTDKAECIIWALSHKADCQEIPMTPQYNMLHILKMETPRGLLIGELRIKKREEHGHGANRFCVQSKYIVDLFSCQVSILMVTKRALVFRCHGQGHNPANSLWGFSFPLPWIRHTLCKGHMVQ